MVVHLYVCFNPGLVEGANGVVTRPLAKPQIAHGGKFECQVGQGIRCLVYHQHVQQNIVLMDLREGGRVTYCREAITDWLGSYRHVCLDVNGIAQAGELNEPVQLQTFA